MNLRNEVQNVLYGSIIKINLKYKIIKLTKYSSLVIS